MNTYTVEKALDILFRTSKALFALLSDLDTAWVEQDEGPDTWTVKEVVAHLIVCEQTNWIPRSKIILAQNQTSPFIPIDMTLHFQMAKDKTIAELLDEFHVLRNESIETLKAYDLQVNDMLKTAIHPQLGTVSLSQLLATWVTHDLTHLAQITRILAKQNKPYVGPFNVFLRILK